MVVDSHRRIYDIGEVSRPPVLEFRETTSLVLSDSSRRFRKNIIIEILSPLITMVLTLPVATATVERAFSAMNLIKNDLRNKMSDVWLNDNLVVYTEREIFKEIENKAILKRFQTMRPRRMQLSSLTN
ncbi:General transcription factor 2-related zinc finger protein [Abeliophyllum distichum]|uniref:General transcription factor 2-related zinc finger protein n=1 Tax=Abeliophyllum distichum TaxID=126358 RepID=A0ABD1PRD2_9LAMI